jgi:hypothetical protein
MSIRQRLDFEILCDIDVTLLKAMGIEAVGDCFKIRRQAKVAYAKVELNFYL